MANTFKYAMFITTFIPLWVSVAFLDVINLIRGTKYFWSEVIGLVVILIVLPASAFIVNWAMSKINSIDFKNYVILSATQEKGITSEYLLSYILPLFVFNFTEWTGVVLFLIYFLVLAFLCIRNNNVYANLIFECRGYKFYSCELKWGAENTSPLFAIVISRKNLSAYINNTVRATPLNKPFYIIEEP